MKKPFFTIVCTMLFLSMSNLFVQGEGKDNRTQKTTTPDEIKIYPIPGQPTPRSILPQFVFDVWNYGNKITFAVDKNVGELEIRILDATEQTVKIIVGRVSAEAIYTIDISEFPSGNYSLQLLISDYPDIIYEGNFKVVYNM